MNHHNCFSFVPGWQTARLPQQGHYAHKPPRLASLCRLLLFLRSGWCLLTGQVMKATPKAAEELSSTGSAGFPGSRVASGTHKEGQDPAAATPRQGSSAAFGDEVSALHRDEQTGAECAPSTGVPLPLLLGTALKLPPTQSSLEMN